MVAGRGVSPNSGVGSPTMTAGGAWGRGARPRGWNEVTAMKAQQALPLGIIVGIILVLVWKSPSGSAEFLGEALGAIGRFLERLANTLSTFIGGLTD